MKVLFAFAFLASAGSALAVTAQVPDAGSTAPILMAGVAAILAIKRFRNR